MHTLKFFKDAQKAFKNIAILKVEGKKVMMINIHTGIKHKFIDSSEEIYIKDIKLLNKIKEL